MAFQKNLSKLRATKAHMQEACERLGEIHDLCNDAHPEIRFAAFQTGLAMGSVATMIDTIIDLFIYDGNYDALPTDSPAKRLVDEFRSAGVKPTPMSTDGPAPPEDGE